MEELIDFECQVGFRLRAALIVFPRSCSLMDVLKVGELVSSGR